MKTSSVLMLCALLVGAGPTRSSLGGGKRSHYTDEVYGFSLDAPRFPDDPAKQFIPVKFFAPTDAGGMPNVNVMVQKGKATRKAYLERSMERAGIKDPVHRDLTVSGHEAVEIDLRIVPPVVPQELRQRQLAVFGPDRVIVVTCTAAPDTFRGLEPEIRACLASLRLGTDASGPAPESARRSCYVDESHGFRIDVPRFRRIKKGERCRPVAFLGPPVEGFASNVVVTVGPPGTREGHREVSSAEFKKGLFKHHADRDLTVSGRDAVEYDVEGQKPGEPAYRLLSLAVFDKDRMYRVACMAPADSFAQYEAEFRACLASFRLAAANP